MLRTMVSDSPKSVGKTVVVKGWVNSVRSHGKITFFDLRDRSGLLQVVTGEKLKLKPESVIEVTGLIVSRQEKLINPNLATGSVELQADQVLVISAAADLPIPLDSDGHEIEESHRLRYRYLDLRRPRMSEIIRLKSRAAQYIRTKLHQQDFVEIETPILTKSTPEGARDFLVPSRLQPGCFYALPQSPQQYKQLLMVAGFERYFQFARCFRDEDPRKDRAYGEFTQLDLEMSFVDQNDILTLIEELFTGLVKEFFPHKHITRTPWPRLSHQEVMDQYGTDKPDLRNDKNDPDELAFSWTIDFPLFTKQSEEDYFHGSGTAKFAPSHHMFTAPHPKDIPLLSTDPMRVRGLQHDLVLNGYEVGGGSIRIHQPEVQAKIFDLIGFSVAQKQEFAHMLEAFTYGVPPHGGIAPGLDRLLMTILGETSIREVIAFPTSSSGQTSVMDAPSHVSKEQLAELRLNPSSTVLGGGDAVYSSIVSLLDSAHTKFESYEHQAVFTSEEAAQVRGTSLAEGAKALVVFTDKQPAMLVLSAADSVDSKAFKKTFGIKDFRMAGKDEVESLTGLKLGSIPPFGSLFGMPTYVEKNLSKMSDIAFNAGLHTKSLKIKYADWAKLERPLIGSFSK